ncbi:MAG TPA: Mur ligase family protein, partial [Alphaproteobacteria bacterium]|nr:Mur ligase family protein [Alphaproteobacteria bacterium]
MMIGVTCFANQTIGVLGLARSGLSTVRALLQGSAKVWAWDDSLAKRQQLDSFSLTPVDLLLVDPKQLAALVISPGIPTGLPIIHPVAGAMKKANIPIFCDIELLLRMQPTTKRIGITGTNGKSTTTHLIGHILKNAGISAEVGGNIGTPVLDLQPIDGKGVYVLELSSFQLELMETFSFDVGVLLNITPDHLDRHGTMNDYVRIKQHIFLRQQASQTAIIGIDDAYGRDQIYPSLKKQGQQQVIPISGVEAVKGG